MSTLVSIIKPEVMEMLNTRRLLLPVSAALLAMSGVTAGCGVPGFSVLVPGDLGAPFVVYLFGVHLSLY